MSTNVVSLKASIDQRVGELLAVKGGSGSGNFHHAGRPGEVGGSEKEASLSSVRQTLSMSGVNVGRASSAGFTIQSGAAIKHNKFSNQLEITHIGGAGMNREQRDAARDEALQKYHQILTDKGFSATLDTSGVIHKIRIDLSDSNKSLKGGDGSGNFQHSGRPGEIGGSAPRFGSREDIEEAYEDPEFNWKRLEETMSDDTYTMVSDYSQGREHGEFTNELVEHMLSDEDFQSELQNQLDESYPDGFVTIFRGGSGSLGADRKFSNGTLDPRIAHDYASGFTGFMSGTIYEYSVPVKDVIGIGNSGESEVFFRPRKLTPEGHVLSDGVTRNPIAAKSLKGGEGSGFHGHAGRPGEVGGSTGYSIEHVSDDFDGERGTELMREFEKSYSSELANDESFFDDNTNKHAQAILMMNSIFYNAAEYPRADVLVARNPAGKIVGALSYEFKYPNSNVLEIDRMGSLDPRAGFRLFKGALKQADELGSTIKWTSSFYAEPFWAKTGFKKNSNGEYELNPDQVRTLAAGKRLKSADDDWWPFTEGGVYIVPRDGEKSIKGGSGSGNFGHAGREGKVGGSAAGELVFHGTSDEFKASIQEHGLMSSKMGQGQGWKPEENEQGHVFFSTQRETAEYWADHAVGNHGGKAMILTLRIPKSAADKISEDPDLSKVAGKAVGFRIKGDIPPEWIVKMEEGKGW